MTLSCKASCKTPWPINKAVDLPIDYRISLGPDGVVSDIWEDYDGRHFGNDRIVILQTRGDIGLRAYAVIDVDRRWD